MKSSPQNSINKKAKEHQTFLRLRCVPGESSSNTSYMTDSPLIITSVHLIFLFFQPTDAETFFERRQRRVVVSAPLAIFTRQVCNKSCQIHQNTSLLYWTSAQKKRGIPNVNRSVLWHPLLSLQCTHKIRAAELFFLPSCEQNFQRSN